MSLFSAIGSLYKDASSDSIMDDNIAVSEDDNNPYVATVVLTARNAYDTLHWLMAPMILGKKSSLKQIKKWINDWEDRLQKIVDNYKELLDKIKDLSANFESMMTLDFAKEAWEIIQDTPILRRYMGEANYWYLHDMVGLLATQSGSLAGDLATGAKAAIKAAILAMISMTDGLLCLESYLGMIQQYWGALYLKGIPLPLLDSIVPNVTCAYWYKKPLQSISRGTTQSFTLGNLPPGKGFTPIPLPVPDPIMYARNPAYIGRFSSQNPDTWYLEGTPYYLPNTMRMLRQVLEYWGSSYTDAWLPAVNNMYPRRAYGVQAMDEAGKPISGKVDKELPRPLQTGKTFAQLDTDKMSLNGTDIKPDEESDMLAESKSALDEVFFTGLVELMDKWQYSYDTFRTIMAKYFISQCALFGKQPTTLKDFIEMQNSVEGELPEGFISYRDWINNADVHQAVKDMASIWQEMETAYASANQLEISAAWKDFFTRAMKVFVDTARVTGLIGAQQTYIAAPSYLPDVVMWGIDAETLRTFGIPYATYTVGYDTIKLKTIEKSDGSSNATETTDGDTGLVEMPVGSASFVMFPSDTRTVHSLEDNVYRMLEYSYVAKSIKSTFKNLPGGLKKEDPKDEPSGSVLKDGELSGMVMGYKYPAGMLSDEDYIVGSLPDALYMPHSCGMTKIDSSDASSYDIGNYFFPDGELPATVKAIGKSSTFVTLYHSFIGTTSDATEELADVVGYSIDKGRESKFPCFGVYGNLLSMQSWHYKEMPLEQFKTEYSKIKSGFSLYYKNANPSEVIYYHSSYASQARDTTMAVYHEYLDRESKSYGSRDSYDFYVFPCESVSVSIVPDNSIGRMFSVDAIGPDGKQYHYIPMRNPIPKCAKYVDPEKWSIMDIVHEMYLLAENLAGLCGDNGKRLKQLNDDLSEFNISQPKFIGQLPSDNGKFVTFHFGIFDEYAQELERLVNSVYVFREQIIAATETL